MHRFLGIGTISLAALNIAYIIAAILIEDLRDWGFVQRPLLAMGALGAIAWMWYGKQTEYRIGYLQGRVDEREDYRRAA